MPISPYRSLREAASHSTPSTAVDLPAPALQGLKPANGASISWFDQVRIYPVSHDEVLRYDPHGLCFWNINTPTS